MAAKIKEMFFVQAFQHGAVDPTELGAGFETEKSAFDYAKENATAVPYDQDYQHEYVVFKAAASFRGRVTPIKHTVEYDED